jgi:hypothetical protein
MASPIYLPSLLMQPGKEGAALWVKGSCKVSSCVSEGAYKEEEADASGLCTAICSLGEAQGTGRAKFRIVPSMVTDHRLHGAAFLQLPPTSPLPFSQLSTGILSSLPPRRQRKENRVEACGWDHWLLPAGLLLGPPSTGRTVTSLAHDLN